MKTKGWELYNNAMVPSCEPHEEPNLDPILQKTLWKCGKKVLFARYTVDFDCCKPTNWWYVIKDTPFDIESLKAKRRYEVNKGIKNFDVRRVNPADCVEELYEVQQKAFMAYAEKYRPHSNKESYVKYFTTCDSEKTIVIGAFSKDNGKLCGYSVLLKGERAINFIVQKTVPEYEKFGINAALVNFILSFYKEDLQNGSKYICDGARSVVHETSFQDYLEKYFDFRKAYCKLVIKYNPKYNWIFKICYCFRKLFYLLDGNKVFHKINGVLKMEEIARRDKKNGK